jgi:hypothetical protein
MSFITHSGGGVSITFEDAVRAFETEYRRSNGFGSARLPVEGWDTPEVRKFIRRCQADIQAEGVALTAMRVSVNMAEKLGLPTVTGSGSLFEGVPAYVAEDCGALELLFGPYIPDTTGPIE